MTDPQRILTPVCSVNKLIGVSMHEPRLHLDVAAEIVDGKTVALPYPDIEETEDTPPISVYVSRTGGRGVVRGHVKIG